MMSTQNQAEHGVIHSSIALLQERFRQLQRVKEMREQKQLLRLFSADNYKIHNNIPSDSSCHFQLSSSSPLTTSTTTTATTTTTTTTANNNDVDDVVMVDDDELHIFLPPNYYHTHYSRSSSNNNNNKPNSSSLSHISYNNNNNNQDYSNNINNNLTEISLSLWPPAISYNNANANAGDGSMEAPLSTLNERLPSSCVSTASKFEDCPHVSDVDTTLHL